MYKTKTQKKNALVAISRKAFKLYESGIMSMAQLDKVNTIVIQARKKL
tara:strand:+ start:341 stop:484 length:144 start_codon:yes stop_codon:yes gene_type:complete